MILICADFQMKFVRSPEGLCSLVRLAVSWLSFLQQSSLGVQRLFSCVDCVLVGGCFPLVIDWLRPCMHPSRAELFNYY